MSKQDRKPISRAQLLIAIFVLTFTLSCFMGLDISTGRLDRAVVSAVGLVVLACILFYLHHRFPIE